MVDLVSFAMFVLGCSAIAILTLAFYCIFSTVEEIIHIIFKKKAWQIFLFYVIINVSNEGGIIIWR
jgi:hypothetical protein